jgi:dihydroorotate dehydrogenase electron transfer subunit
LSRLFGARVKDNVRIAELFGLISVEPLSDIKSPQEGQFFMVEAARTYDPLLKRPFSLFRYRDGILQFLYRIRGKGTRCISEIRKGEVVQMLGPLGNSYPAPSGDFVILTGGIGIASVFSLLDKYPGRAHIFCGARNCDELLMLDDVERLAKKLYVTTDDGTYCRKGLITEPLKEFIESETFKRNPLPIYACGPTLMLRELSKIADGKGLACYISLEEVMACGVGACLGCVTGTVAGYKRVCKEGPVFSIEDVIWE